MEEQAFTVLYVDDEPHNLTTFRAAFRRQFQIVTALGAREGMDILAKQPVQLVISDQRMPEITGVQFLEQVAEQYPDIIRVILTGFSDLEALISAINRVGIFRYLTKPWHEPDLMLTMENARQLWQLRVKNKILLTELNTKISEQQKVLELFRRYVPSTVVDQVLGSTDENLLKGEVRPIGVLFCDVRGFTSISERLTPRQVVQFLNRFYSLTTSIVKRNGGSTNQFIGDEVFAIFGAPDSSGDDAYHTVVAALEMREGLQGLNQEFAAIFGQDVYVGIGLHYGVAVAGNMGSSDRINYSVIGDTVNTAKHIEGLTKESPNSILMHAEMYALIQDRVDAREWGKVPIRGKREPVHVVEVLGLKG